ncbi:sulfatase-like hydrolase/transferase [Gaoshiqia sediminis]|uniref:Sulfatase-like hydrolase/transferase n=1 Tax=Gaoshiqia sediminis TaxID=2986998 RepID=A0AA42C840_9BACT|nr:sulfatase-like hydrolase/transferase [Gaoshiqia sediminis]MCW0484249.1 sulfatase-like hydrolase/transferase [Gaoshiqia sediminis]
MKRIVFLYALFFLTLSKISFGKQRPNILFVFIDDMGYGDLACYGNIIHETPNIDRLASEGIRFTQFYVNAPICSPSRVAVTTGQYPCRWGISSFINDHQSNVKRGMKDFLSMEAPSLARNLKDAGYYTAHIGKWHMGGGRDVGDVPYIAEYGFDESVTQFEGIGERYLATYETLNLKDSTRNLEKMSAALGKGDIHWIKREDCTETYVARAIEAIKHAQESGKPFYINLWPDDVHTPSEPPRELRGDGGRQDLYSGVMKEMDCQLERIFSLVRSNPDLRENTLIILTSDNGPAKNVGYPGVLSGHKGNLYEGGIREPLIIWGPSLIAQDQIGNTNSTTVIAGMDLPPSIIQIAGAKMFGNEYFDGLDMSQCMLGFETVKRNQPIMWQRPAGITKMDRNKDNPDLAIREGDYKLLINIDGSNPELYNIVLDETESTNIVEKYPEIVSKMKKKVLDWYAQMPQVINEDN